MSKNELNEVFFMSTFYSSLYSSSVWPLKCANGHVTCSSCLSATCKSFLPNEIYIPAYRACQVLKNDIATYLNILKNDLKIRMSRYILDHRLDSRISTPRTEI